MFARVLMSVALTCLCCLTCSAQSAGSPPAFAGLWVVHLGKRVLLTLELHGNGDRLEGSLERPAHMAAEGNTIFSNLLGGTRRDRLQDLSAGPGEVQFRVTDLTDNAVITKYALRIDGNAASLSEADGPPGTPLHLQRASRPVAISTDWQPNRTYSFGDTDTDSSVMKALYDEDQRVRISSVQEAHRSACTAPAAECGKNGYRPGDDASNSSK